MSKAVILSACTYLNDNELERTTLRFGEIYVQIR